MRNLLKNNTVFIITMLSVVFGADVVTPNNRVEKKLLDFFEKWRMGDTATIPIPLPSLKVIVIPSLNGSYSGKGVKLTYYSSRIRVVGMNYFSVTALNVSLSDMSASGSLTVPLLGVYAEHYSVEGRAFYVYSLQGSGKLNANFKNIELAFSIKLARNGTHTNIRQFNLNFNIGDIQVNLQNSSWPMNKVLNNEGVKIIEGYREDIVTATEKNLVKRLDTYLTSVTPTQLLNIMQMD